MKNLLVAFFLVASLIGRAQPAAWTFVLPINNPNGVMDVATDKQGNTYVTGRFVGSLQVGSTLLTSASPGLCLYIAKCDPSGQALWATKLEGASDVMPRSIAVDNAGNSYVTGGFWGTLTYNGGQQTSTTVNSSLGSAIFLLKCGPSGTVRWVQQAGSSQGTPFGYCTGTAVAIDRAGNSYICGHANGSNIRFGALLLGEHRRDGFLASYNRSGLLRWARVLNALRRPAGSSLANGIVVDRTGNCYVSGYSFGGWTLDGITLPIPTAAAYLAKFDARHGQLRWAKAVPGDGGDGTALALDKTGGIYVGGNFTGTVAFGSTTLTSMGDADCFVARYAPTGNIDWATAFGGPNYDAVNSLAVDQKTRQVFATGLMNFTALATNQSFMARLDARGQMQQLEPVGGPGTSSGGRLAIDKQNNVYSVGVFTGGCQFGSIALSGLVTQSYFGRYGSPMACNASSNSANNSTEALSPPVITLFPNPAQNQFTLRLASQEQAGRATLHNQLGRVVAEHAVPVATAAATADIAFDTTALPDGLYTLRVESDRKISTRLVMVQH